jgi:hypothetical protein
VPGPDEAGKAGPLSKEALRQLHSRGVITHDTWVWAPGMQGPARLSDVRELRWMCCSGLGLLGPFEAALVALQVSGAEPCLKFLSCLSGVRQTTMAGSCCGMYCVLVAFQPVE